MRIKWEGKINCSRNWVLGFEEYALSHTVGYVYRSSPAFFAFDPFAFFPLLLYFGFYTFWLSSTKLKLRKTTNCSYTFDVVYHVLNKRECVLISPYSSLA